MKYIFITGGVVSSLGKGLTAASLGALLEERNLKISLQKFDPYLNVDPGTMSPFQHGEVYVLNDGAETDLDLGHYERFTHAELSRANSVSSGQIYETVIQRERRGDYLGKTVQVIPHITDEIKSRIYSKRDDVDVVITEIGGTIGDIEGLPFLEAMRQFALEVGKSNVLFIHVTLIPFVKAAGELKTKPSQQSVAKLREIGIQPDILVCRSEYPIAEEIRQKLSLFCNVPRNAVIQECDVETSIYELPLVLHAEQLDEIVIKSLNLNAPRKPLDNWRNFIKKLRESRQKIQIGFVGKYIELQDAYKSVYEALTHAGVTHNTLVEPILLDAELIQEEGAQVCLEKVHGMIIPGGFGDRGIEGKILAAQFARERNIPFLGICLGMQIAGIEFARHVAQLEGANSTEFDPDTRHPVIDIMEDQKELQQKGASMRLGAYTCSITGPSKAWDAYQKDSIQERHRHRFEFNNRYREILASKGLIFSGINTKRNLVEILELPSHPWFVGVQFHPEFQSKPLSPHPLFKGFIGAALQCFLKN